MAEEPDYILDIDHLKTDPAVDDSPLHRGPTARRWLGIQFECCGVYARVYRNRQGTAYVGHCPRCARAVRIRIGAGGTMSRFFRAC